MITNTNANANFNTSKRIKYEKGSPQTEKFIAHFLSQCAKFLFSLVDLFSVAVWVGVAYATIYFSCDYCCTFLQCCITEWPLRCHTHTHFLQRRVKINSNILSVWMKSENCDINKRILCAREQSGSEALCGLLGTCVSKCTFFFSSWTTAFGSTECNIWRNVHWMIGID